MSSKKPLTKVQTKPVTVKGNKKLGSQNKPEKTNLKTELVQTTRPMRSLMSSDDYMTKHNPYLASLRNPLECPGARIPDNSLYPSTTVQVIYHSSVDTNSNGFAGVIIGCSGTTGTKGPYMVPQSGITCNINGASVPGAFGLTSNSSNGSFTVPFGEATGAGAGSSPFAIPNIASFLDSYGAQVRVVSCGLSLRSTSSFTNNQGFYVAGSLPAQYFYPISANALSSISGTQYQNFPGAMTRPAAGAGEWGIECTYNPGDPRCLEYALTNITTSGPGPTDLKMYQYNPGILYAFLTGAPASTTVTLLVDIVVNYEIIIKSGNIGFGVRPAYEDPLALATAANVRANENYVSPPSMFNGDNSGLASSLNDNNSTLKLSIDPSMYLMQKPNSFSNKGIVTDQSFGVSVPRGLAVHVFSSPVKFNLTRSKKKGQVNVASVSAKQEVPLFESVVNGLLKVAQKVAPALLALL